MILNNLLKDIAYRAIKLKQWIVNHPRTASSYMALLTSVAIASLAIIISTPSNLREHPFSAHLLHVQTGLQTVYSQTQPSSNATTSDSLILANSAQPTKAVAAATNTGAITATNNTANTTLLPNNISTVVNNSSISNDSSTANTNNAVATTAAANTNNDANLITKTITVRNKDSLAKIFNRLKLVPKSAKTILTLDSAKSLRSLKSGEKLNFSFSNDQKLQQITYKIDQLNTLIITASAINNSSKGKNNSGGKNNNNKTSDKFIAKINHIEPTTKTSSITATINNGSIYNSAKSAGISRKMVTQIGNIFSEKLNITKLKNGDRITVLCKDYYLKDKKIKDGDLEAVEIINKDKSYRAIAYTDPTGNTDFYTPEGYTLKSAFVRYPFKFKYISSPFSMHRFQPLLHIYREHTGIDLVGERGTPVKATSNGVIALAGYDGGYGNVIILKHNQYSTKYAHLQGFASQIHHGSAVRQGQVIGYLGSTGSATGPHVHFEFRINDEPVDPAHIKLPGEEKITAGYRGKFASHAKIMLAQLNTSSKPMYAANSDGMHQATSNNI